MYFLFYFPTQGTQSIYVFLISIFSYIDFTALHSNDVVTTRLKIETEAWARSGLTTTVGSSYVLEPGLPVETRLYDGKLYTLSLHRQGESSVKILQTPGDISVPHSTTELEVSEEGLVMRLLCRDTTATIEFLRCEHEESQAYFW